ncbi:MAG TPA: ribonuclease T2 [Xanthobacteraceae bacterium]|nr:ribonuclease T2 [Xanthobacteraceae bacterium]
MAAILALGLLVSPIARGPAAAQDRRQNQAGQFDFYVLSLSWSPSFCDAAAERAAARGETLGAAPPPQTDSTAPRPPRRRTAVEQQCGERPYAFVVHGLWPQYEKGFPEFCEVPAPRLNREIVSGMLDLMPSPRLIFREWDRHGTCSGLPPRAYFDTVRKARAVVKIPETYLDLKVPLTVTPDEVEDAFVKANPGLTRAGISVSCDSKRLSEVRLCLNRDLGFRDCAPSVRRACRRERIEMPPMRGG